MAISIAGPSFVSADLTKDKLKDFDGFHLRGVVNDAVQHVSTAEHTQKVGDEAPPNTSPDNPVGASSYCYDPYPNQCPITGQLPDPNPKDLVWSDEFHGTAVNTSNWVFETGNGDKYGPGKGWGNNEWQYYMKRNAVVSDGILHLTGKREDSAGKCPCNPVTQTASGYGGDCTNGAGYCTPYTSTKLTTNGHHSFKNKRVQFRVNLSRSKVHGTWAAGWLLPTGTSHWPRTGEIDVLETVGHRKDRWFGTTHTANCNNDHARSCNTAGSFDEWHTVEVNWLKDQLQFALDGQIYHTISRNGSNDPDFPFDKNFYLILNLAVGGDFGGGGHNPRIAEHKFEGDGQVMQVDWVRVYKTSDPGPPPSPVPPPSRERCGCHSCSEAWNTAVPAAEDPTATCGSRINWAMQHEGKNEHDACALVASQFHKKCPCDPSTCASIRILEQS